MKDIRQVDDDSNPDRHIDLLNYKGDKIDSKKSALFQITANDGHIYCFDLGVTMIGWKEQNTSREESTLCHHNDFPQLAFIPRDFGINMGLVEPHQESTISSQKLSLLDEVQKLAETCRISELGSLSNEMYQENASRFIESLQRTFTLLYKGAKATDAEGGQARAPKIEHASRLRRFGWRLKAVFARVVRRRRDGVQ